MKRLVKFCRNSRVESSEIPEGGLPSWSRQARKRGVFPETFWRLQAPRHCKRNQLLVSAHSNQNATPQITVTTRDCRRHRDPRDYRHPRNSARPRADMNPPSHGVNRSPGTPMSPSASPPQPKLILPPLITLSSRQKI